MDTQKFATREERKGKERKERNEGRRRKKGK